MGEVVAVVVNEDDVELNSTIAHHKALGFESILVLGGDPALNDDIVRCIDWDIGGSIAETINPLLKDLVGKWALFICNAEYFYFPFCENRKVSDLTQFVSEENRNSVHCVTVDVYGNDLERTPNAVDPANAYFDREGYYALDRYAGPEKMERQHDVFGGLKWRFAEHIPWERQRIDRVAFFKVYEGCQMDAEGRLNDEEMNTMACPWHNSLTGAVVSFRVAKSLRHNPGSQFDVTSFMWECSEKLDWSSDQLMKAGFMEPGQWF